MFNMHFGLRSFPPISHLQPGVRSESAAVSVVCDVLRRVFATHGATPVAPPSVRPKPPPSLAPPPAASKRRVQLLDDRGAVVTLPGDLTTPFARFVARSGLTRLKRYQIDRVFYRAPRRSTTETWEADFDIVGIGGGSSCTPHAPGYGIDKAAVGGGPNGAHVKAMSGYPYPNSTGIRGTAPFEVAEAEAILVVSQVMGSLETFVGRWYLRLGNAKMAHAIMDLCGATHDTRSTVMALLGKVAKGALAPAKAWSELEAKGVMNGEVLGNLRPFLHHMGADPFEALRRLEELVQGIPAVKSVEGLPNSGRRRELTKREAVRAKLSLRVFRECLEGLRRLLTGLGRLGLISTALAPDRERSDPQAGANSMHMAIASYIPVAASSRAARPAGGRTGKGSRRRTNRDSGDLAAEAPVLTTGADSRGSERKQSHRKGVAFHRVGGRGNVSNSPEAECAPRIGGELDAEAWTPGVRPAFVMFDLGLSQQQGNYASGTIFQAALVEQDSGASGVGERYSSTVAEGGRYDDLIARHRYHLGGMSSHSQLLGASQICAVGVRFAVEKVASTLLAARKESLAGLAYQDHHHHQQQQYQHVQHPLRPVDAVVCGGGGFEPEGLQERFLVTARLWAAGIRADYLASDALVRAGAGRGGGLDGAAEACLSLGIPFVVAVRPHTLLAKKAVKVLSVMEKGGGQLEVPLKNLAQHMADALASLADPASAPPSQRSDHSHGHSHPLAAAMPSVPSGGVSARLALLDRGQGGSGSLDRDKMSRHEYKTISALERRVASLLDAAMAGPDRSGTAPEGDGPLVLATEASFAAVRGFTTAYMLFGGEGKAVLEMLSDHPEKKCLRNLHAYLQELEDFRRKGGRGQGKTGAGQSRQVFVYSVTDELMDLVTFSSSGSTGSLGQERSFGVKGGRIMR